MKSQSSLVVIWLLFFLAIFAVGYITIHVIVTSVMADFEQPTTGYTTLEVKPVPNNAVQTDQYTPIQPSVTPIGKEL